MSYYRKPLAGDMAHGPSWYRAMGSIASQPGQRVITGPRARVNTLGSLGDDAPAGSTLATPTIADPATLQWQANVLAQLQTGVATLQMGERKAELQKWLQIAATLTIPVAAAIWKAIFRGGRSITDTGV